MSGSLSARYGSALKLVAALERLGERQDLDEFQGQVRECVRALVEISSLVQNAGLFSTNESAEELSTREIRYLGIGFHLAQVLERVRPGSPAQRSMALVQSRGQYLGFLAMMDNYGLLTKDQVLQYDVAKEGVSDGPGLAVPPGMSRQLAASGDAAARRAAKIAQYQAEQRLKRAVDELAEHEANGLVDNLDEEVVRKLYLDQLRLFVVRTFQLLELLDMEVLVLKRAPLEDPERAVPGPVGSSTEFTDRVETVPGKNNAILSPAGKILQPFTLVADKRQQVAQGIFGTGQVLPLMLVEEYLEYELANGKMMKPEEEKPEEDEDDFAVADRKTYEAREWDEFKEANAKGSGNTMNRG